MKSSGDQRSQIPEDSCGWLCYRPSFLMGFRSPKIFLCFVCCGVLMQGFIINGLINVSITSLERRFSLSSSQTGLIAGTYDIAATVFSIPIAYAGGKAAASKPRWIGAGLLLMGTGSLVFSLPHFATPEFTVAQNSTRSACGAGAAAACDATDTTSSVSRYLYVFLLAQLLHGVGAAPLWSLGVAYIDANVKKSLVSMFLGIYYTMALVGPAFGFLGGSFVLNLHTDFLTADIKGLGLQPSSESWVGAWWIGFFCAAFVTWAAALTVLAFPPHLPQSRDLDPDNSETHGGRDAIQIEKIESQLAAGRIKHLPAAVWGCLTNPTFLCVSLAGGTDGAVISGISTFMPKYIQNQLGLPASQAGLFTGVAALIGGATGTVLGGYLVKRFQLRCVGMIKLIACFSVVSLLSTFMYFASCPDVPFAGINVPYGNASAADPGWSAGIDSDGLDHQCNLGCGCEQREFEPFCGTDGITYYSPCHAGCSSANVTDGAECRCVSDVPEPKPRHRGRCKSACSYLPLIVILQTVGAFSLFVGTSPSSTAIVRSVAPRQRSLAMGISTTLLRVVGTIPGPIIYGALIDRSCVRWLSPCDGPGACIVYDNWWMSRYLLGATVIWKIASIILYNLAWILYKAPEGSEEYAIGKMKDDGTAADEMDGDLAPPTGGLENPGFQAE